MKYVVARATLAFNATDLSTIFQEGMEYWSVFFKREKFQIYRRHAEEEFCSKF